MNIHVLAGPLAASQDHAAARRAIAHVNADIMITRAWKHYLKVSNFPMEFQVVLGVTAAQTYTHGGPPPTMSFYKGLQMWLDSKKIGAVERLTRKLENIYIVQRQNSDKNNVWNWSLKDARVAAAVDAVANLKPAIYRVVELQMNNPTDPKIGEKLLPDGIYFNIVANRTARLNNISPANPGGLAMKTAAGMVGAVLLGIVAYSTSHHEEYSPSFVINQDRKISIIRFEDNSDQHNPLNVKWRLEPTGLMAHSDKNSDPDDASVLL